ncbi:LuxR C-terminal-related transcriptional regulator [Actinomycetes bacterium M1A6_2h]
MTHSFPLIRRALEFEVISSALEPQAAVDHAGCGVVLTGAAGVGKTTLAREVTKTMPENVRWVAGTESARSIPLGVFAHLVGTGTSSDPVAFLSSARSALLSSDGPVVIGVDDAHLLDQLSATLLHQLAIDRAVRIVATVRSGEEVPDAVTSLWKDGHLMRVDLTPFTREQSVGFIESVLDGPLEGFSADRMWEASGGNALFLRHLVEGAIEAGTLRRSRGVWQLRGRTGITSELASLLESRIQQLPDGVLKALQLLTFCEPLDLNVLSETAGEEAVEEAERRGLVRVAETGDDLDVRFTHPLFGEVIRGQIGRVAGRRLRGLLVRALKARPVTGAAERIRLAELALDSDQSVDVELLATASQDALGFGKLALGERLARAAVTAGGGFSASDLLARALLWQGHSRDAEDLLTAYDPDSLDEVQLVRWGSSRVANLMWARGDSVTADKVLEIVRERVTNPHLRAIVDGVASIVLVFENNPVDAEKLAMTVLAQRNSLPWATGWAAFGAGYALAVQGKGSQVPAVAAMGAAVHDQLDGLLRFPAGFGEVLALLLTGEFASATAKSKEFLDFSVTGQYLSWGLANVHVGTVELARGQCARAASRLEQALAALDSDSDAAGWAFPARVGLIQAYALLGRVSEAETVLAAADQKRGRHLAVFDAQLELSRAWLAANRGETSVAERHARRGAEIAQDAGQFGIEAMLLHNAVRIGDRTCTQRLTELAALCDGSLVPLFAAHASAASSADGEELMRLSSEFDRIGALPDAMDAAALAAVAFVGKGERRRATEAGVSARALADRCDGVTTPNLVSAANPLPLTSREREVASMVGSGLSNREIAQRLFVSIRTVEGHIYRACTKLDAPDRGALARLLEA